ncbi:unnamed protein product [Blepharisma stoltei]|uniref:protein-serine/threonine phosphatase n=1 Tax=Blepharisma stoltei TaxID=1481888 RepID=A0AAU9IQ36_9CILI|nr:unnamed protein product [Blepharisma stoltei]
MSKTQVITHPRISIPGRTRAAIFDIISPKSPELRMEPLTPSISLPHKVHPQAVLRKSLRHTSEKLPAIDQRSRGSLDTNRTLDDHYKFLKGIETFNETTRISVKQNGRTKAYAASTNAGLVRGYNEDRVSIINNIIKPQGRVGEIWPKCSFFAVYDGHGGSACADFLRDNLHQYIIKEPNFPENPKVAIKQGCMAAEQDFLAQCQGRYIEKSGSCAIIALIFGDMCYVANVGDSRAIMSAERGSKIHQLSRDHKPSDEEERSRIIQAGGRVYQTPIFLGHNAESPVLGPFRVNPGRLSVSRTFGDVEAKVPQLGGNPKVVIPNPEVKSFRITKDMDFILLASDGIYDKLTNREIINCAWNSISDVRAVDLHHKCGAVVDSVIKLALNRRTMDNVTVVVIALPGFKKFSRET